MDLSIDRVSSCIILTALISTVLTACMVGPDYQRPQTPKPSRYTETSLPIKTAQAPREKNVGKSQYFALGKDIPADWWKLFHSPQLNDLIDRGLKNNPTIDSAKASLRNAQEIFRAQVGNLLLPAVSANIAAQRQRINLQAEGIDILPNNPAIKNIFNLYNVGVSISYTLDIFGGARRQLEMYGAQIDQQRYELLATYLTLTSNIVTTAITIASLQDQVDVTKELIREQEQQLAIIKRQFKVGGVSLDNVMSQENLLANTKATLQPLEKTLAQYRNALAILVGTVPGESALPKLNLSMFELPRELPVSLPSSLAQQRPDVLAAEAVLHAATAQVGVATANLFPQFTIGGQDGWSATVFNQLFTENVKVWSYSASLAQPIFRGGALLAQRRAAIASLDQYLAQYKYTLLQAFQNVADALNAIEIDARALRARKQAELAARKSMLLTREQFKLGGVSFITLLTAEQQYQQMRLTRIQAEAARYSDTAALFQALGGGWWQNNTTKKNEDDKNKKV